VPRANYDPEQTRELKWLGQALAAVRKSAGLTQRQLAEAAGRPFSQIADVERAASSMAELGRAYDEAQAADQ
jgi:transcriptional regulator with XRE-family HTH domain